MGRRNVLQKLLQYRKEQEQMPQQETTSYHSMVRNVVFEGKMAKINEKPKNTCEKGS